MKDEYAIELLEQMRDFLDEVKSIKFYLKKIAEHTDPKDDSTGHGA